MVTLRAAVASVLYISLWLGLLEPTGCMEVGSIKQGRKVLQNTVGLPASDVVNVPAQPSSLPGKLAVNPPSPVVTRSIVGPANSSSSQETGPDDSSPSSPAMGGPGDAFEDTLPFPVNATQPTPGNIASQVASAVRNALFRSACNPEKTTECGDNLICVRLPGFNATSGMCVDIPLGGYNLPRNQGSLVYYFPLTGGVLDAWPYKQYTGRASGLVDWVPDEKFGNVMYCKRDSSTKIMLDSVPYGRNGSFAINLWMRKNNTLAPRHFTTTDETQGAPWQYMFSHASSRTAAADNFTAFLPNQVNLYTGSPGAFSSGYGIARAIVKDFNDNSDPTFLDSNGRVSERVMTATGGQGVNVSDGEWHMVTVTTRTDGGKGYSLYVDGQLAAQMPFGTYTGAPGQPINGGDLISLDTSIHLCGRVDEDFTRSYEGALSQLMIFANPLGPADVKALYDLVQERAPEVLTTERVTLGGEICQFPASYQGQQVTDCIVINDQEQCPTIDGSWKPCLPRTLLESGGLDSGMPNLMYDGQVGSVCTLYPATQLEPIFCAAGLVCAPALAVDEATQQAAGYLGVCAPPVRGVLLPQHVPSPWPQPMAYFPLTEENVTSWPFGASAVESSGVSFSLDSRFGQVLTCNRSEGSYVQLEHIPYAENGSFAINIWFKLSQESLEGEGGFEYILSHAKEGAVIGKDANQVNIYIPQERNGAFGSVRVLIRDGDDHDGGRMSDVWLDTSGHVGAIYPRLAQDERVQDFRDSEWHMLTVTTDPEGDKGYSIYVDGQLKASLRSDSKRHTNNIGDQDIRVPGGDPMDLNGSLILCGRADLDPNRFMTGYLSNLMLFNEPLDNKQVASLFSSYQRQAVRMPMGQVAEGLARTTIFGDDCLLPTSFGGEIIYDCIYLRGVLSCPVASGDWVPCKADEHEAPDDLEGGLMIPDGSRLGPSGGKPPRVTRNGQMCLFNQRIDDQVYEDCADILGVGVDMCQVASGELLECAPQVSVPPESTYCTNAVNDAAASEVFERCVSTRGVDFCLTVNGTWLECPPPPRFTSSGEKCAPSYEYAGLIRTDCVVLTNNQEYCVVANSTYMEECEPVTASDLWEQQLPDTDAQREAMNGKRCTFAAWNEPSNVHDCTDPYGSGTFRCVVEGMGSPQQCAPVLRKTWSGSICQVPFLYQGRSRDNCVWVSGWEACRTEEGSWEECIGEAQAMMMPDDSNRTRRITTTGQSCVLPYVFEGQFQWDCTDVSEENPGGTCRTSSGTLEPCVERATNVTRMTLSGQRCEFPFFFSINQLAYDCVSINNASFCQVANGDWQQCIMPPAAGKDTTPAGDASTPTSVIPSPTASPSPKPSMPVPASGVVRSGPVNIGAGDIRSTLQDGGSPGTGPAVSQSSVGVDSAVVREGQGKGGGMSENKRTTIIASVVAVCCALLLVGLVLGLLARKGYFFAYTSRRFREMPPDVQVEPTLPSPGHTKPLISSPSGSSQIELNPPQAYRTDSVDSRLSPVSQTAGDHPFDMKGHLSAKGPAGPKSTIPTSVLFSNNQV